MFTFTEPTKEYILEIITNLIYDPKKHAIVEFLKRNMKPLVINHMEPRVVDSMLNNSSNSQAIQKMISANWTTMRICGDLMTGQHVRIILVDGGWCHIYLISTGMKDRIVLLLSGTDDQVDYIDFGFRGEEETFKKFLAGLNITEMEAYMNANYAV